MPDADSWTEQSYLGCSSVPFLSLLIRSSGQSAGYLDQGQEIKSGSNGVNGIHIPAKEWIRVYGVNHGMEYGCEYLATV
nr:hypothetical protein [Tanacetum cinerariifolium]